MMLGELLADIKNGLKAAGIESSRLDSELIAMRAVGCSRLHLITRDNEPLTEKQLELARDMLQRRLANEPMQYILGHCEFMGLDFELNRDTLIPRGDTECLVELALEYIKKTGAKTVLDIGTGSGAIAISLAKYAAVNCVAVDICKNALDMAAHNAEKNGVSDRVSFIESDVFKNVEGRFDVIVSNPPYIVSTVIPTLAAQVKDYEPMRALDGGSDGLDFYRTITAQAHKYLNNGGYLAFEIGYDQGEAVSRLLTDNGYADVKTGKDLAGLDRTVSGVWLGVK